LLPGPVHAALGLSKEEVDTMRPTFPKLALLLGATANFCVALFHLIIVFVGAPGYRYFGVTQLAEMQEKGSIVPAALTLGLTMMFALFATYALSGAGVLRRGPFLRTVLVALGAIYILRGLPVIRQIIELAFGDKKYLMAVFFSGVSLLIGISFVIGAIPLFKGPAKQTEA
jgi:hypothetical protein